MAVRAIRLVAAAALCVLAAAGCATLPDTDAAIARHTGQAARFENASGPVSAQKSAAVLAELKRKSGDIDILEKQIALEQAIVDSPLVLGNKVTLLQDGAATYAGDVRRDPRRAGPHQPGNLHPRGRRSGAGSSPTSCWSSRRGASRSTSSTTASAASSTPKAFFDRLTEGGIAVLEFNPVNPLSAATPWLLNHRDHRKLLVVDGRIAFIGGINISSVYSSGSVARRTGKPAEHDIAWRDTDLQIEGPVVGELQKLFMETWEKQHGKPLAAKDYFPALKAQGKDIVRAIGSTPDDPYSLMYLTLISAIGNAEKQVYLTNAYFVPDRQLLKALIGRRRARRRREAHPAEPLRFRT